MRAHRYIRSAVAASFLALAACGGNSSSPAAPSSSSTTTTTAPAAPTTATATTTTTSGVFTFTFEAGTRVADQDLVKNSITAASNYFQSAFGRMVQQPTSITLSATSPQCAAQGAAAATGIRSMIICGANGGWNAHDTLNKQKILTHEAFHLVQFEMRWTGGPSGNSGAQWLIEGSAEYVGWRGVAAQGLIGFDTARGCQYRQAADKGAAASASLDTMETPQGFNVPWAYEFGMMGVDQLVTAPGMNALLTYGTALSNGTAFTSAFQSAFGTTTSAFYAGFPSYRAGLAGLSSTACGT